MSTSRSAPPLPPGLTLEEPLAPGVLRVRRGEAHLVLRWIDHPGGLESEWAALARVRHPRLVAPIEWGRTPEGRAWLLRPWLEGSTLDRALPAASPEQRVAWTTDVLDALDHLHAAGLVHRDVRGPNVVVSGGAAHLVDLDLVAAAGARAAGTPTHLAPEVRLGRPHGPAADLFALGVTLALALLGPPGEELLTRFPARDFWEASGLDPELLPEELRPLVRRLLLRRPDERPASAAEAAGLLAGRGPRRPDPTLPPLAGRQEVLDAVAAGRAAGGGPILLAVDDPAECDAALAELPLALACHGEHPTPPIDGRGRAPGELVALLRARREGILVLPSEDLPALERALEVEDLAPRRHVLGVLRAGSGSRFEPWRQPDGRLQRLTQRVLGLRKRGGGHRSAVAGSWDEAPSSSCPQLGEGDGGLGDDPHDEEALAEYDKDKLTGGLLATVLESSGAGR